MRMKKVLMTKAVWDYLSAIGRRGGSVKSAAKAKAAQANAKKPRPRGGQ